MKKKSEEPKVTRKEVLLISTIILLLVLIPLINVYSKALVSETNIELEKINNNIKKQESINESLNMKISELTSLEKIQEIAKKYGLTYNNDNIIVIDGSE